MNKRIGLFAFVAFLFSVSGAHAAPKHFNVQLVPDNITYGIFADPIPQQPIYDLPCPAGTSPLQPYQTTVPATGHLRAWACVDPNGVVTLQSAGGGGIITGCSVTGGVLFENGTPNTGTCNAAFAWNNTLAQLNVGATSGLTSGILTALLPQQATSRFTGVASVANPNNYAIMALSQSTNSTTTSGIYSTSVATGNADASDFAGEYDSFSAPANTVTQTLNGAIISFVQNNGPGNVTDLFSVGGQGNNLAGTTTRLSAMIALSPFVMNGTGGTVHNVYGFQAQPQTTLAADTLNVAFHAEDQGTNAKWFSFYSEGSQNRFKLGTLQTLPIFDVSSANPTTPYGGSVTIRGDGLGMVPDEGEPALLELVQHTSNTVGFVLSTADGPTNNSMDVTMAIDGSTNWTHSTNGTEADFISFNADGSEESHPATGQGFKSPIFLAGNGTAANPSISFAVDPTTGFYVNGAGVIRHTISGVDQQEETNTNYFIKQSLCDFNAGDNCIQLNPTANGAVFSKELVSGGTTATISGTGACATITGSIGGTFAGSFQCTGTTGASTITITPGISSSHGWTCNVYDETTRADNPGQTTHTTAHCVVTSTATATNDIFSWSATGY
jgi:hypothetical protein